MNARFIIGDSLTVLRSMPAESVDLVLTSPPFLALRSYLPADHPDKAREIGSEPTPGEFIDTLLGLTEEWRRVLAPHGSIAVELGDTYAGSGGAGGDYAEGGLRDGQGKFTGSAKRATDKPGVLRPPGTAHRAARGAAHRQLSDAGGGHHFGGDGWPEAKSLCLIPELYRISLVYGFNPLTGRTTERWRGRNVVRWHRPNPPVGALGDKFRPSTSDMIVACVGRTRYFDLDAVRTPSVDVDPRTTNGPKVDARDGEPRYEQRTTNPAGAPPLDTWVIPTEPYKGSHYATWPSALLTRPILAMCPQKVCRVCGKPSERITGEPEYVRTDTDRVAARLAMADGERVAERVNQHTQTNGANTSVVRVAETVGWTECGHDDWRPGVVLDPFAGSGTTLAVATGHGRDAIGIDLDERNADLARERVGMWLEVERHNATSEVVA